MPGHGSRDSQSPEMSAGTTPLTGESDAQSARTAVDHVVGQAQDAMQSAATKGEEAAGYISDATISLRDAVQDAIERQPFTAVAIAAVAGLLIGVLYKRH